MPRGPDADQRRCRLLVSPRRRATDARTGRSRSKKGNRYLAGITGETAVAAGKTHTREGARYRRLARRRGKAKAQVAVGNTQLNVYHKLAWRERHRLTAADAGTATGAADADNPVTMARVTAAELLRSLRAEADRVAGIADRLREAGATVTDPTAAEVEVETVRAAAEQRAVAAEARAAAAEQRAAEGDQFRAEADAAAEEMAGHLAAAQASADEAETARANAENDRDAAIAEARSARCRADRRRRGRP